MMITNCFYVEKTEETLSRIRIMRYQEESAYQKSDYLLKKDFCPMHTTDSTLSSSSSASASASNEDDNDVDSDCRTKMAMWYYQIITYCKFNRETAEIAMSYLDRYLSTKQGSVALQDRCHFQLASMTSLYTAVKIHEYEAMDPNLVVMLSRGLYTVKQIEDMERQLLAALDWRMNPPTSMMFCREFIDLIPDVALDYTMKNASYELAKLQSEHAVLDYAYVGNTTMVANASTIAFCSFMNALETFVTDDQILGYIGTVLSEAIGIDCNSDKIVTIQSSLYESVVSKQIPFQQSPTKSKQHWNCGNDAMNSNNNNNNNNIGLISKSEVVRTISPRSSLSSPIEQIQI